MLVIYNFFWGGGGVIGYFLPMWVFFRPAFVVAMRQPLSSSARPCTLLHRMPATTKGKVGRSHWDSSCSNLGLSWFWDGLSWFYDVFFDGLSSFVMVEKMVNRFCISDWTHIFDYVPLY